MQTAVEWAREHGRPFRWTTLLNNYEPPRPDYAFGDGWFYDPSDWDPRQADKKDCVLLDSIIAVKDAIKSIYLIDDGTSVRPYYVASWHDDGVYLILHPFPVNVNPDGTPRLRADDQRPVDYTSWELGPRRAYHVKIQTKDAVTAV